MCVDKEKSSNVCTNDTYVVMGIESLKNVHCSVMDTLSKGA